MSMFDLESNIHFNRPVIALLMYCTGNIDMLWSLNQSLDEPVPFARQLVE